MTQFLLSAMFVAVIGMLTFAASFAEVPRSQMVATIASHE